jgi:hypothetical protein
MTDLKALSTDEIVDLHQTTRERRLQTAGHRKYDRLLAQEKAIEEELGRRADEDDNLHKVRSGVRVRIEGHDGYDLNGRLGIVVSVHPEGKAAVVKLDGTVLPYSESIDALRKPDGAPFVTH